MYDISYDFDGDGVVGNQDLFLSRLFDKDNDGMLDEDERKIIIDAIEGGIEKKFHWNMDKQGINRDYRLI